MDPVLAKYFNSGDKDTVIEVFNQIIGNPSDPGEADPTGNSMLGSILVQKDDTEGLCTGLSRRPASPSLSHDVSLGLSRHPPPGKSGRPPLAPRPNPPSLAPIRSRHIERAPFFSDHSTGLELNMYDFMPYAKSSFQDPSPLSGRRRAANFN